MSNGDRRVPTAADVERWGKRWWYESASGERTQATIRVYSWGAIVAHSEDWHDGDEEPLDDTEFVRWLGPVSPEPLPWLEGGRCGS